AIDDAKIQMQSTLIEIKVLPKTMPACFDGSWWNVGVAEVSEKPAIQEAYQVKKQKLATASNY
ncbi:hypothetical protein ACPTFZ_15375, partial [Enterococcus faecalis]|uniref:hypothetical protein n=1 Tax=Enterococcus faecalis TaxID=1351 RepID=UPI003CC5BFDA